MLKSFSISSFKNLEDFQIPLTKINIFLGESNVGKTSALKSLMFYFAKDNKERFIREYIGKESFLFPFGEKRDIEIIAHLQNGRIEKEMYPFLSANVDLSNPHSKYLSLPFSYYDPSSILTKEGIKEAFYIIEKKQKKDFLIGVLRSIDNLINDLFIKNEELYVETKYGMLPFDDQGMGIKRLFTLVYLFLSNKNKPFFLDLVEKGFHPLFLRALVPFFDILSLENHQQLFIATHSNKLVEDFKFGLMNPDNLTVIYMEKGKVTCYKADELHLIPNPYRFD